MRLLDCSQRTCNKVASDLVGRYFFCWCRHARRASFRAFRCEVPCRFESDCRSHSAGLQHNLVGRFFLSAGVCMHVLRVKRVFRVFRCEVSCRFESGFAALHYLQHACTMQQNAQHGAFHAHCVLLCSGHNVSSGLCFSLLNSIGRAFVVFVVEFSCRIGCRGRIHCCSHRRNRNRQRRHGLRHVIVAVVSSSSEPYR